MPYWRAVPRSDTQALADLLPVLAAVPVTVSCFGSLVLKITVPAAVVAVATVFSPVFGNSIFQPLLPASFSALFKPSCVSPLELSQLAAACRQLLVRST